MVSGDIKTTQRRLCNGAGAVSRSRACGERLLSFRFLDSSRAATTLPQPTAAIAATPQRVRRLATPTTIALAAATIATSPRTAAARSRETKASAKTSRLNWVARPTSRAAATARPLACARRVQASIVLRIFRARVLLATRASKRATTPAMTPRAEPTHHQNETSAVNRARKPATSANCSDVNGSM